MSHDSASLRAGVGEGDTNEDVDKFFGECGADDGLFGGGDDGGENEREGE